jgi:putative membrane protein insertion efficiency factor
MSGKLKDIAVRDNLQQKNQQKRCSKEQVQTPSQGVNTSSESQSQAVSHPVDRKKGFTEKFPSGNAERDDVFFQQGGNVVKRAMKYINPVNLFLGFIWLYRKVISPWMFPCCRFTPTCSEYAQNALQKHGLIKGSVLSAWRIARCNPFCKGGYEPTPDKFPPSHGQKNNCGYLKNDLEKVIQ